MGEVRQTAPVKEPLFATLVRATVVKSHCLAQDGVRSRIQLLLPTRGTKLKKSLPHVSVVLPVTSFRAVSLRNR
jgi:hypothetical protein